MARKTRRYNYNKAMMKWELMGKRFAAELIKAALFYKCETPGDKID